MTNGEGKPLRFTITYGVSGDFHGYKVSIPNYDGGDVVSAWAYDALLKQNEEMFKKVERYEAALKDISKPNPSDYRTDIARRALYPEPS